MSRQFGIPVCDVLLGYFDEQTRRLSRNYHLSMEAVTTDSIHDLRVAIKRLRALFQLVDWIDNRFEARNQFRPVRRLFKAAGPIRDTQVQLEICRKLSKKFNLDLSGYVNYLLQLERGHRQKYISKADKFELDVLNDSRSCIKQTLDGNTDDELLFRIGQRLTLQIDQVVSLTDHNQLTDTERHQIRIATKAVRYTLEARRLSSSPDMSLDELNIRLRSCHQALGRWHDFQVGKDWLTDFLKNRVEGQLVAAADYVTFARYLQANVDSSLRDFENAWIELRDLVKNPNFSVN